MMSIYAHMSAHECTQVLRSWQLTRGRNKAADAAGAGAGGAKLSEEEAVRHLCAITLRHLCSCTLRHLCAYALRRYNEIESV